MSYIVLLNAARRAALPKERLEAREQIKEPSPHPAVLLRAIPRILINTAHATRGALFPLHIHKRTCRWCFVRALARFFA